MCAISGIINFYNEVSQDELLVMSDRMSQRGPDDSNIFIEKKIGLAHRRLSVIDLETGQQPMKICNGDIVIVFNGEIYNFQELKSELAEKGATFHTHSDTEVIAVMYEYYGIEKCLESLEGMFAFAIYDKRKDTIYLARDKFGEKPLFYHHTSEFFSFASELKAFAPDLSEYKIDKEALNLFLKLAYIPAPYTIYKGIKKLMPGHYVSISEKREIQFKKYFDLSSVKGQLTSSTFPEAQKEVRSLLVESVKKRMISDVPMGAFLSGGIDSSIICTIMSRLSEEPINTFSIGFKEKEYDESDRAKIVAKKIGSRHSEYILDYKDVIDVLDDIILYYDEPFADSSAIPSYYVAKVAREKVKVVLTGDCADELFAGYKKYLGEYYANLYRRLPKGGRRLTEYILRILPRNSFTCDFLRRANKIIDNTKSTEFDAYYNLMSAGFSEEERKSLLKEEYYVDVKQKIFQKYQEADVPSYLLRQQYTDVRILLEGCMFPKVDRACMHNSLESRAPFIDSAIVRLALNLPDRYKIKGKNKKYILKEAFKDLLPRETLKFSKKGFGVPVDYWFRNELKEELLSLLNEEFIREQRIFDFAYISKLLETHFNRTENHKDRIWNLFVFQKWYLSKLKV